MVNLILILTPFLNSNSTHNTYALQKSNMCRILLIIRISFLHYFFGNNYHSETSNKCL